MNPQDRTGVRTALDIERKYNLKGMTKAVEMQKDNLYKLDVNLNSFVNAITKDLDNLQDQVDGNITTWFYNGEPTLETYPTTEWKSEEYNIHLGDLYYDSNTGYSYRFTLNDNVYDWKKLTDTDVTKALAMANSAKDTADSKRRIFIETPTVPYDNGDMWIKNEEIYICQISKDINQAFNENDFIVATKYTDNTLANQVNDRVTVVAGQVTTIEQNVSKISAEMEDSRYYVDEEGNKILITEQINKLTASAYGLNQVTSNVGGNNIFRNVGLWFTDTPENPNTYLNSYTYCNYNQNSSSDFINILFPISETESQYIRNDNLMSVNSSYQYNISLPTTDYEINSETYLLELDSNQNVQKNNDEIIMHSLVTGDNYINLDVSTKYICLLIKKTSVNRNIEVGDNLSGVTVYSSIPDNFYLYLQTQLISEQTFVKTSSDNILHIKSQLAKGLYYVGCNTVNNATAGATPYPLFYAKNDMATINESSLTLADDFGVVSEINSSSPVYQYLTIGQDETLSLEDLKNYLKETKLEISNLSENYEFWNGNVVKSSNDNSDSYTSMLLQKGVLFQEQEVPNGNYSVSFFYQKLNTLANASVVINDKEYSLDSTEIKQFYTGEKDKETEEYITQPIVVTSNHIKIEFKCDVNNGVEIWDLMCNKGTVKLAWSQNQNETTTETVNISKGITITSTNIEAIFKANANGIKILTLQGATVAYFTDKGMSTNELVVKNKAEITGMLCQKVGNQRWISWI